MNAYQDSQTSNIEEQFTRRITGKEGEDLEGKHIWIGPTLLHVTEHGRFQCRVEGQQSHVWHNLLPNAAHNHIPSDFADHCRGEFGTFHVRQS